MRDFISKNVTQNSFSRLKLQIYISVINTFTKKNKWRRSKPILKPLLIAMNFLVFALKFLLVRITAYFRSNIKHLTRLDIQKPPDPSPSSRGVHLLDETILLVFNILLLSVSGYQMKHSFSCLIYYFSVFGYQMEHSFSCLIYHLLVDVRISDETLLLVFDIFLLEGLNRTLTAHLCCYRSIADRTQEALLIGRYRKRHSFESEYRFSGSNTLTSIDNKLDEWQCLPLLMGVNRLTNLEHRYHNYLVLHRMLAFCLQLRQWSDTRQAKDSGLFGHIASSFDPYL